MHKTKLLKLLGISLIVGILGLTGFCKKSKDNNDLALAGLVIAQQQAEQAAYQAANNTDNPQWFCAQVWKDASNNYYSAILTPLVEQDCNKNYWGYSNNVIKQKLLATIDGDPDLTANCPNTKNAISNYDFSDGGALQERFYYKAGSSLLSEVSLSQTDFTVVAPNTYKRLQLLGSIGYYALSQSETNCGNVVSNKMNEVVNTNTICSPPNPPCSVSYGRTKVVFATCVYGSNPPAGYPRCATLNDQF